MPAEAKREAKRDQDKIIRGKADTGSEEKHVKKGVQGPSQMEIDQKMAELKARNVNAKFGP